MKLTSGNIKGVADRSILGEGRQWGWLLFFVALALYLPGIDWGLPYATDADLIRTWATDSITPLGPLAELHNTLIQSKPDHYVAYPLMHYFLLATVYSPYLLYLFLTGQFAQPSGQYPFGFADPIETIKVLEVLARLVSMCMAAGVVVIAYRTAKCLWGPTEGLLAGLFTMLMYPMFYYSRTGNLDVPVLFWASLGIMFFAEILQKGVSTKRAVWLGICAALATATKDQGWGVFAFMPPVLLAVQYRRTEKLQSLRPLVVGLLVCVVTYSIASGLVINPTRYFAHLNWIRQHVPFPLQHVPATVAGYAELLGMSIKHLAWATGPLMLAAAVAGIGLLWSRERLKLAIVLPAIGYFLVVIVLARLSTLRYMMPIALIVCLLASRALAEGLKASRRIRLLAACSICIICGSLLVLGADLTYQMRYDSRYEAGSWLNKETQAGDKVGHVISHSYLPRLKPGLEYFLIAPESSASERISQGRPRFIVIMPDWTTPETGVYPAGFPEHTYRALKDGSLGYQLVTRFKTDSPVRRHFLDYPTVNPPLEIFRRSD